MTRRWPWLLGWGLLTALLVAALRGVAWDEAVAALREADALPLVAAVAANAAILPLGAVQWRLFLPRGRGVPFGAMLWIVAVTSTVSNGGLALAGHAAGIHLLATRGRIGYAAGVGVTALDQLAEGVAKLALVGWVLLAAPIAPGLRVTALVLALGVPGLGLVLLVAAHRVQVLEAWTERAPAWSRRGLGFLVEVAALLDGMRRPGVLAAGVALALLQKAAEGAALFLVLAAVGLAVPFWGVLLALAAVNLSTLASVTPANLGVYEAGAVVAYRLAGLPMEAAVGAAVLQHAAYLLPLAGSGWVALALGGPRPSGPASPREPAPAPARPS